MTEVVVLSGKGGVGKSSITASLGVLLARRRRLVLADTDVDAPNLHLVLGAVPLRSREIVASEKAVISLDRCVHCMTCRDVCRFGAIAGEDEPLVLAYACEGCGACAAACPEGAIAIREVTNGRINTFAAQELRVVGGELFLGGGSSGRIVDLVKRAARAEAEAAGADLILVDGPPGIGCPVISAAKGADFVIAVTEPTPAAVRDLTRVLAVVEHFGTPFGIVLNRADLHERTRATFLALAVEKGYRVLAEIPCDQSVARALAIASPVVSAYPDAPASLALGALAAGVLEFCALADGAV